MASGPKHDWFKAGRNDRHRCNKAVKLNKGRCRTKTKVNIIIEPWL